MTRKITPAQLDEIEAVARAATGAAEPSDWQADVYPVVKRLAAFKGQTTGSVDRLIECDGVYGMMDGRVATHIATFDPPTVLALIARLREAEQMVRLLRDVYQAKCDRIVAFAGLAPDDLDDSMDMEAVEEMVAARIEKAEAKVERVREVHEPIDAMLNPGRHERVVKVCIGCGTDDGNWQRWPCPTIRALDAN